MKTSTGIKRWIGVLILIYILPSVLQGQQITDQAYQREVLQKVDHLLETHYVMPDKARQYAEAFRKVYASGAYDTCSTYDSFAEKVHADLVSITHDKHTRFRVVEPSDMGENVESNLHHPVRYQRLRMKEHTGFTKLEWIDGRIGYLELRRFNMLSESWEMLGVAMKFLVGADAIIIDIRENGGGMGDFLSSYFLPHPTQLTGIYYREGDDLQEHWTTKNTVVAPMLDVPLFVLTSRNTFSAAEFFAYDMKTRKRATLVGDTTKGGAHDTGYFKIDDHFELYLSIGMAVNPVTQTNWEAVGIAPDVRVPASAALDTAVVLARKAADAYGQVKEAKLKAAVETMQTQLDRAESLYAAGEDSPAKAALDSLFVIGGEAGLVTEFFNYVLAYNYLSGENRSILYAILHKSIELFPQSPTAYETLAMTYDQFGEPEEALEYYEKALQLDPANANVRKRVEALSTQK